MSVTYEDVGTPVVCQNEGAGVLLGLRSTSGRNRWDRRMTAVVKMDDGSGTRIFSAEDVRASKGV